MGCSPQGFSVHGILQARILGCVAVPFSRGSSWPRDQTRVSCIADRFFTIWATREALQTLLNLKHSPVSYASGKFANATFSNLAFSLYPKPCWNLANPCSFFRFQFLSYFLTLTELDLTLAYISELPIWCGTCLFSYLFLLLVGFCLSNLALCEG